VKAAEAKKMAEEALVQLAGQLEQGQSEQLRTYLKAMARFPHYSVGNSILIALQRPDATHVAGYKTWQKLHRQVREGESGIAILAPIPIRRARTKPAEQDSSTGTTAEGEEQVVTFRSVHVFDVAQTEGRPLPEPARVQGDPEHYTQRLLDLLAAKGIALTYSAAIGAAEGLSAGGRIVIRPGLGAAEEFSVLVHELGHELLHRGDDRPAPSIRELEAEAVAFVVGQTIGLDCGTASSDYVLSYEGKKETLLDSLERIRTTAAEILAALTTEEAQHEAAVEQPADAAVAA
jgi:antirestriction protein ArdC